MKIIDTYWEKKNLNVESEKYIINSDDDVEMLKNALAICNKEYIEADVAPGCIKVLSTLEENGFRFIETAIGLGASVSDVIVPKSMRRFAGKVSYVESTGDELQIIKNVIRSGEMFLTDKVSLNPCFGKEKAGNRYGNWVESLLESNARCFSIHYMEKLVGFEISILKEGVLDIFLGGGFPNVGVGAGAITVTASYSYWMNQNIKQIKTRVSSNNFPVLKLHELFGLKINDLRYILVKNFDK